MPADIQAILNLEVPLIVELARRSLSLEEIMELSPGSIIELPKRIGDDLDILVNNMAIGSGAAVKVGENFGIRVSGVGKVEERITALTGVPDVEMGDPNRSDSAAEAPADSILAGQ